MALETEDSLSLKVIGRAQGLFIDDLLEKQGEIKHLLRNSRCLVIGGAGAIGQAVALELFKRNPKILHVVDLSENNMVELVRSVRSSFGYSDCDFRTFSIDCGSLEFAAMYDHYGPYDYVFNLSALKHVRSEKDPYTLMRLIQVNILNTLSTISIAKASGAKKYFCVSTDKAANPVNMMGASKKIMELFLMRESLDQSLSMARFANVAFSDGSLLHGFSQRILKQQPLSAPLDTSRFFITKQEAGELCLLSALFGENRDIFIPKIQPGLELTHFNDIAARYLDILGYEPFICSSEDEARARINELIRLKKWPCFYFYSDTTGEKSFEEFATANELVDTKKFKTIEIIKNSSVFDNAGLDRFSNDLALIRDKGQWDKPELVKLFESLLEEFSHEDSGKYLDGRM